MRGREGLEGWREEKLILLPICSIAVEELGEGEEKGSKNKFISTTLEGIF